MDWEERGRGKGKRKRSNKNLLIYIVKFKPKYFENLCPKLSRIQIKFLSNFLKNTLKEIFFCP